MDTSGHYLPGTPVLLHGAEATPEHCQKLCCDQPNCDTFTFDTGQTAGAACAEGSYTSLAGQGTCVSCPDVTRTGLTSAAAACASASSPAALKTPRPCRRFPGINSTS